MPRKTTVGVAATPLFPDPPEKEPYSDVLVKNVVQKQSIPNDIIRYHSNSFDGKMDRYYDYAKNHYIYGLPFGYGMSTPLFNTAQQDIANVISQIEGTTVQLLQAEIVTGTNADDEAKFFMKWYREYVPSTGTINPYNLGLEGTVVPTYDSAFITPEGQLSITYTLDVGGTHTEIVDFRYYAPGIPVIVATYRLNDEVYTWVYAPITGEFPTLTKIVLEADEYEYYPIVPIRHNKINIAEERKSSYYNDNRVNPQDWVIDSSGTTQRSERNESTRKLLNTLGLNLDDLSEAIKGSPDIEYIDDAYLNNCILVSDKHQPGLRYMFEYFNRLALTQTSTRTEFEAWLSNPTTFSPTTQIIIKDRAIENDAEYHHNLIFNYVETTTITNSGTVGTYYSYRTGSGGRDVNGHYFSDEVFVIGHQTTPTQRTIMKVHGLRQLGYINKGNGERLVTETTLEEAFKSTDPINGLFVPLCRNIIADWDTADATDIAYRSMHIIVQSVVVTKIKWYQTGIFKIIVIIIAAIISVWTQNPLAFQSVWAAIYAIAYAIVINVIIGYIFQMIFRDLFNYRPF